MKEYKNQLSNRRIQIETYKNILEKVEESSPLKDLKNDKNEIIGKYGSLLHKYSKIANKNKIALDDLKTKGYADPNAIYKDVADLRFANIEYTIVNILGKLREENAITKESYHIDLEQIEKLNRRYMLASKKYESELRLIQDSYAEYYKVYSKGKLTSLETTPSIFSAIFDDYTVETAKLENTYEIEITNKKYIYILCILLGALFAYLITRFTQFNK